MNTKIIKLTESDLHNIVKESVEKIISEADRHREGYWKERWAKQKAAREKDKSQTNGEPTKSNDRREYYRQYNKKHGDRHKKGYYKEYNKEHPERLNRGFTKGYNNGNVDDGKIQSNDIGKEIFPGIYIKGYDELGRPITNDPFGDMLRNKEMEWHDDDWDEGSWDD